MCTTSSKPWSVPRTPPPGVRGHFANALQRMLGRVAWERGKPPFGTCASCKHLEGDGCSREGQAPYACGFASAPLLLEELDGVCINFVPGKPMTVKGSVNRNRAKSTMPSKVISREFPREFVNLTT